MDEIPPKTRNMKKIKVNTNNLNSKNNTNDNDTKSKFRTTTIIKKSKKKSKKLKTVGDSKNNFNDAPPKKESIMNTYTGKSNLVVFNVSDKYLKNEKDDDLKLPNKSTIKKSQTDFKMLEPKSEQNKKEYDNFELNHMEYEEALENDHRKFEIIYWSILRREHLIIFSLFTRNDYNLTFAKISRLFFSLATDMCLNVFFFSDETMHIIYLDYGKYNFVQNIPQIIYSAIISQILDIFLCFLSLTDKSYYLIKNSKTISRYGILRILKCIKIKLTIFFIVTFILFMFHWYAITCFCAVYRNTQSAFIKDSLSSFAISQLYPFILYLFPSICRILSLRNCKSKYVYLLSDIIPFF